MKIGKEMTIDSHNIGNRGFEEDHNIIKVKKEDAKANGKRISKEELDKEIAELKEQLDVLRMLLEENQRKGWVLRKKAVKWHKSQRRLQQRQVKLLVEKLREAELEMKVSICEEEQGEVLGEDEDWRSTKDLMNYCTNSRQQEVYFAEEGIIDDFLNCWINSDQQEDVKPCIFESNNFDVITGFAEGEQCFEAVKSMKSIFQKIITLK